MEFIEKIHRMVWVGKGLKDHLAPTPCRGQDTFHQTSLLMLLQPDFEHCQGWGIHNLSGNLCQGLLHSKVMESHTDFNL